MDILLIKFCNDHGKNNLHLIKKDSKEGTPGSSNAIQLPKGANNFDFTTATSIPKAQKEEKKGSINIVKADSKKGSSTLTVEVIKDLDEAPAIQQIILPEYVSEVLY